MNENPSGVYWRKVICPRCGAKPGRHCLNLRVGPVLSSSQRRKPHAERRMGAQVASVSQFQYAVQEMA